MSITVGTQVCFGGDPADTGTVCEIEEVDRRSSGRMGGQGGGQFLGSTKTLRYRVTWDNGTCTGDWYRESELTVAEAKPVASTAFEEIVDQVDEITQAWTGRTADRPTIRWAIRNITEVAQLRGQADLAGQGFFRLLAEEPSRVPLLVKSATSGRAVDCVIALVEYGRK